MLLPEQRNYAAYHPWKESYVRTYDDCNQKMEDR
jgi:hypothetical protein